MAPAPACQPHCSPHTFRVSLAFNFASMQHALAAPRFSTPSMGGLSGMTHAARQPFGFVWYGLVHLVGLGPLLGRKKVGNSYGLVSW